MVCKIIVIWSILSILICVTIGILSEAMPMQHDDMSKEVMK